MIDIYQKILDETFDAITQSLKYRYEKSDLTYIDLEEELESMYNYDGLGIDRAEIKQAEIDGTIAAYQVFMDNIRNNKNSD